MTPSDIPTRVIYISNREVALPQHVHEQVQARLSARRVREAIALLRQHVQVAIDEANRAVWNPANFTPPPSQELDAQPLTQRLRKRLKVWRVRTMRVMRGRRFRLAGASLLVIGLSWGFTGYQLLHQQHDHSAAPVQRRYVLDMATGQLQALPLEQALASRAVMAHLFACGQCGQPSPRAVAYLSQYQEDAGAEAPLMVSPYRRDRGQHQWMEMASADGLRLIEAATPKCPDGQWPAECLPQP